MSKRFIRRIKLYLSFKKVYRGSLVLTPTWKTETGLTALLSAGMALMGVVTAVLIKTMFFDTQSHTAEVGLKNMQPPPLLTSHVPIEQKVSNSLVAVKNNETLFQLNKPPVQEAPPAEQHAQLERPHRTAKVPIQQMRPWHLQIHRPSMSTTHMEGIIANAHELLQSGQVSLARQAFLMLLTQDAHSVEAIAGMLLVSRQLGDSQSEEEYLEKLRQEIPDYEEGTVMGNEVSSIKEQG
ncbi:MAG: hypothetical protein ACTS9Y_05500 [Methylophilus sp.]|uniref:hypothetical protein n=1 Tax=Methylophilus sp. TaxID=29541 RepID=UPI003FA09E08